MDQLGSIGVKLSVVSNKMLFEDSKRLVVFGGLLRLCADLLSYCGAMSVQSVVDYTSAAADAANVRNLNASAPLHEHHITFSAFFGNGYVIAYLLLICGVLQVGFFQHLIQLFSLVSKSRSISSRCHILPSR